MKYQGQSRCLGVRPRIFHDSILLPPVINESEGEKGRRHTPERDDIWVGKLDPHGYQSPQNLWGDFNKKRHFTLVQHAPALPPPGFELNRPERLLRPPGCPDTLLSGHRSTPHERRGRCHALPAP